MLGLIDDEFHDAPDVGPVQLGQLAPRRIIAGGGGSIQVVIIFSGIPLPVQALAVLHPLAWIGMAEERSGVVIAQSDGQIDQKRRARQSEGGCHLRGTDDGPPQLVGQAEVQLLQGYVLDGTDLGVALGRRILLIVVAIRLLDLIIGTNRYVRPTKRWQGQGTGIRRPGLK